MTTPIEVECPVCGGHERSPGEGEPEPVPLDQVGLFKCNACQARVVYGQLQMRVVIEPHVDDLGHAWVRRRYQDPKTRRDLFVVLQDPKLAADEAINVLSMVSK